MKKILITGFTGLLGSKLIEKLKDNSNYDLIGVTRNNSVKNKAITIFNGSIYDKATFDKIPFPIDIIIHLASNIFNCTPQNVFYSNIYPAYIISKYAEKWNCEKIIFASSSSVYGEPNDDMIINEKHKLSLDNLYSYSKFLSEQTFLNASVSTTILRYTYLYDHNDKKSRIGRIIDAVKSNKIPYIRNENRDLLSTSDAANAIIKSISYSGGNNIFNIGSGRFISMNEIISTLEKMLKRKIEYKMIGKRFNYGMDYNLAKEELKWNPTSEVLYDILNYFH